MDKANRVFLLGHGYQEVDDIKEAVRMGNVRYLHIDVYRDEPPMMLARVEEESAFIAINTIGDDKMLIIMRGDSLRTCLFSVPLKMITGIIKGDGRIKTVLFNIEGDSNTYKLCYR